MCLRGSCLCGAVQYEIDGIDSPVRHCHCVTCRKAQAAAFASTAGIAREHFRWIAGEDNLIAYESSPGKFRRFCATCGTHILAEYPERRYVMLSVATLDDDPGVRPVEHIWISESAPWLKDPNTVTRHPEWYPEY